MDANTPQADRTETGLAGGTAYRVIARKYRPKTFEELIGQEPMVRTLKNAFAAGRIAQAYMLTGVRGVGKTTTARILARALNYHVPGKVDAPTLDMPELGTHCEAIIEGRHVDVHEMDAASHTGIGDIREIIDSVRYRPTSARYKVYIIDEVHMLSTAAFNGLLKTLEEPPEHVKFVFATTEIRKVPVTVLSRCQRFDLRRVEAGVLIEHLKQIAAAEGVDIEEEALRLLARASEGSVRDAQSLLDQAIAHGAGRITAAELSVMLGLADRARIVDLFEHVMKGDAAAALAELRSQYEVGADPAIVLTDLADFTHLVTRMKLVPDAGRDAAVSETERRRGAEFAARLSVRVLSRAWQILLKGIEEVRAAPRPLAAADMVLVRLAYASDLPTPDEALKLLRAGAAHGAAAAPAAPAGGSGASEARAGMPLRAISGGRPAPTAEPAVAAAPPQSVGPILARFEDLVALAASKRDIALKLTLERDVRVVRFERGRIEIALTPAAPADFTRQLAAKLADWTGTRWMVALSREAGRPTLREQAEERRSGLLSDAREMPLVKAVLERFPGARIVDVRVHGEDEASGEDGTPGEAIPPPPEDEDEGWWDR